MKTNFKLAFLVAGIVVTPLIVIGLLFDKVWHLQQLASFAIVTTVCILVFGFIADMITSGEPQKVKAGIITYLVIISAEVIFSFATLYQINNDIQNTQPTVTPAAGVRDPRQVVHPPTGEDWYEILQGIYARPVSDYGSTSYTECYFYGNGLDYCAGEVIQYYTLKDQMIVYEQPSAQLTILYPIIAGEITIVVIPPNAINLHWRFIDTYQK